MLTYRLYWLDGVTELCQGRTITEAITRAGYGAGALSALDFYKLGDAINYNWDGKKWMEKNR